MRENPDREWQTRRVMNPQPDKCTVSVVASMSPQHWQSRWPVDLSALYPNSAPTTILGEIHRPRYQPGEVVYLKEAWKYCGTQHISEGGAILLKHSRTSTTIKYSDGAYRTIAIDTPWRRSYAREGYQSPLFMPEWAARDFATILTVQAERLQEITFEDCLAEGIVDSPAWTGFDFKAPEPLHPEDLSNEEAYKEISRGWEDYAYQAFQGLWDSINPKYPWASNPFVWRYTLKLEVK